MHASLSVPEMVANELNGTECDGKWHDLYSLLQNLDGDLSQPSERRKRKAKRSLQKSTISPTYGVLSRLSRSAVTTLPMDTVPIYHNRTIRTSSPSPSYLLSTVQTTPSPNTPTSSPRPLPSTHPAPAHLPNPHPPTLLRPGSLSSLPLIAGYPSPHRIANHSLTARRLHSLHPVRYGRASTSSAVSATHKAQVARLPVTRRGEERPETREVSSRRSGLAACYSGVEGGL